MLSICVGNLKGGTAKTTTTAALADLLGADRRVLAIDLDAQGGLTQALGIDARGRGMAEVIGGATRGALQLTDVIQKAGRFDLAPSDVSLADYELGLVQRMGREAILKSALANLQGYDLALIDCPPSLSLLTINALTAAHGVIVPTLPSASDLRALKMFLESIDRVRENINPGLQLIGAALVQYDARLIAHAQALEAMQAAGIPVLATIARSVRAQEASAAHEPVTTYAPGSRPAQGYIELAERLKEWLRKNRTI